MEACGDHESATLVWANWYEFTDDGLVIKVSGFEGDGHWTGIREIKSNAPDFEFWRWFVAQKHKESIVTEERMEIYRTRFQSRQKAGFAIIELPLFVLLLLALSGVVWTVISFVRQGEMTRSAWVGIGMVVPFALAIVWLVSTSRKAR